MWLDLNDFNDFNDFNGRSIGHVQRFHRFQRLNDPILFALYSRYSWLNSRRVKPS